MNNKIFVYLYIYPAMAMMGVLWVGDLALSSLSLVLFAAYSSTFLTNKKPVHVSGKAFCVLAMLLLVIFEFFIIPAGQPFVRYFIYGFTALAVVEILILKTVRTHAVESDSLQ